MKKHLLLFIFPCLIACSCYSNVEQTTRISEIHFGYGGGFTNQQVVCKLTHDGKIFQGDKLLKQIPCEQVEQIFNQANEITTSVNEYGNIYWFIEIKGKQNKRYVWTGDSTIQTDLNNLFNTLNTIKL